MQTRIVSLLALALTTLPGPAAAQEPRPGASDPRLKWVVYNEREVIEVLGHYGFQTLVQFGSAEEVTDVSLGDGLAWQVDIPARKNLLFLKPVEDYAATNLTVLTTRPALDGSGELTRVYVFSLVATVPREEEISGALHRAESEARLPPSGTPATKPADFTWVIHFHYPQDQAERLALRVRRQHDRQSARVSPGRGSISTKEKRTNEIQNHPEHPALSGQKKGRPEPPWCPALVLLTPHVRPASSSGVASHPATGNGRCSRGPGPRLHKTDTPFLVGAPRGGRPSGRSGDRTPRAPA